MSWVTIIWTMVASACLTMAARQVLIGCRHRTAWASLLFAVTAMIVLAALTGCQTTAQPGSGSHASVRISGATDESIRHVVASVFQKNGYTVVSNLAVGMVLERPASPGDSLKWGGWGKGSSVVIRLKIELEPASAGDHVVKCDVFYVSDRGDRVFEDEKRLIWLDRRPYQRLLDEVSQQAIQPTHGGGVPEPVEKPARQPSRDP